LTDSGNSSLADGNPVVIITAQIVDTAARLQDSFQMYYARNAFPVDNTACTGAFSSRCDVSSLAAPLNCFNSYYPCHAKDKSGDLHLIVDTLGGGNPNPSYTVTTSISQPIAIAVNTSANVVANQRQITILKPNFKQFPNSELSVVTLTSNNNLAFSLFDARDEICSVVSPTYSFNNADSFVFFCHEHKDEQVIQVGGISGASNSFSVQYTHYPSDSEAHYKWDNVKTVAFNGKRTLPHQVVEFDVPEVEAWSITITVASGDPNNLNSRVYLYKDCTPIDDINCSGDVCNFVYEGDAFSGRVRLLFSSEVGSNAVYQITYLGGLANNCYQPLISGRFCAASLTPGTFYYRDPSTSETQLDDLIKNQVFPALTDFFNGTLSVECVAVLTKFVCQSTYRKCDSKGVVQNPCESQCNSIRDECGLNACFHESCIVAEIQECTGNPVTIPGVPSLQSASSALTLTLSIFIFAILAAFF